MVLKKSNDIQKLEKATIFYYTCKNVNGVSLFFFLSVWGERFKIKSIVCIICLSGDESYHNLKRKISLKTKIEKKNKKYWFKIKNNISLRLKLNIYTPLSFSF